MDAVDQALLIMLLVSALMLVIFNSFFFAKSSVTVLKSYNWFMNAVITAAVVIFHFPVSILIIVFMFPLLHNSVSIFGWNKQEKIETGHKIYSLTFFSVYFTLSVIFLLGTVILKEDFAASKLKDMFHVAVRDSSCAGSNLHFYICVILVPNVLTII